MDRDQGWLPTLAELERLKDEDPYYRQFGWSQLVVSDRDAEVLARMDELGTRFYERYAMRMVGNETLERWQMRLQNRFDEVVDRYNRAYALYDEHAQGIMDDVRTGFKRTVEGKNTAGGRDRTNVGSIVKRADTPDSQVNASDDYADSFTKSDATNTTDYGRTDTNEVEERQEATGILLKNLNRTIDEYKDIDTMFVSEFETLFLNVFWYRGGMRMAVRRISYVEAYDNRSVPVQIAGKQDKLTPGANIAISDENVISAFGEEIGGYVAGEGIEIDQNVISCTVQGGVTQSELDAAIATCQPAGDYATRTEVQTGLSGKQDVGDYATVTQLDNGLATKQNAGDYATSAQLTNGLAGKQDYSVNIRNILIGTDEVPSASLGEDGDIYIYKPRGEWIW